MTAVIDRRATRNMCTPLVKRIICRRRGHLARGALRTSPGHIRQRYSFRTDKFGFIAKPSQTICVYIFLSFSLCLRLKKCVYIYMEVISYAHLAVVDPLLPRESSSRSKHFPILEKTIS